jgi:hypothetical protein
VAFERTRRLAIFGDRGKLDTWLVSAVGISLLLGALMFAGYRNNTAKLADPYAAANLSGAAYADSPKRDSKLRAQRVYLATGETISYEAGGENVVYVPTYFDSIARTNIVADIMRRNKDNDIRLTMAFLWSLSWLPALLAGVFIGRQEYRTLSANYGFQRPTAAKTFAEVEGLINMLRGACEDPALYQTLELILTQPDHGRKAMLRELITEMRGKQAPADLIDAFICLTDDAVAEKAYTVIYKCERNPIAMATA